MPGSSDTTQMKIRLRSSLRCSESDSSLGCSGGLGPRQNGSRSQRARSRSAGAATAGAVAGAGAATGQNWGSGSSIGLSTEVEDSASEPDRSGSTVVVSSQVKDADLGAGHVRHGRDSQHVEFSRAKTSVPLTESAS